MVIFLFGCFKLKHRNSDSRYRRTINTSHLQLFVILCMLQYSYPWKLAGDMLKDQTQPFLNLDHLLTFLLRVASQNCSQHLKPVNCLKAAAIFVWLKKAASKVTLLLSICLSAMMPEYCTQLSCISWESSKAKMETAYRAGILSLVVLKQRNKYRLRAHACALILKNLRYISLLPSEAPVKSSKITSLQKIYFLYIFFNFIFYFFYIFFADVFAKLLQAKYLSC